ncbi:MAG: hypothetical protein P794_03720 [Epsilonproteobacteria bacterium (ex Lamellibrachia satsuma)]|nr:MAG: hypothetical protein P794_03720 [Epsilonproteobacteria bacterium (ex Lamellibrachia satsuma)]
MYPIGKANLYALLGYGQVSLEPSGGQEYKENGFQWGIGANYAVTEKIGVFIDYTRLYDDTGFDTLWSTADVTVDAVSVGLTYTF